MIINTFQFFNEFIQLKIRLEELWDVVDYFVIQESTKTHSGNDKPFYLFDKYYSEFEKYKSKLVFSLIYDTYSNYGDILQAQPENKLHKAALDNVIKSDWFPKDVESYLRDTQEKEFLIRGLEFCNSNDIILFSDADEIPKASTVKQIIDNFDSNEIYNLRHDMYFYYLNILKEDNWLGTTILTFDKLLQNSVCKLRVHRQGKVIENAGWHFSYLGGIDQIRYKIQSWGEQSLNNSNTMNNLEYRVKHCLTNNIDLFGRQCKFWKLPVTYHNFPKYVVDNKDTLKEYIYELE